MMNGLLLLKTAFKREATPRNPWVPYVGCHGGALIGVDAAEYLSHTEHLVNGANIAIKEYKADGIPVTFDLQIEAECLGCGLQWAEKNPPAVVSHPLVSGTTLEELVVPGPNDGRIPIVMEAARQIRTAHPDIGLYGLITGPFTLALHLLGTDIFMKMFEAPDYVDRVLSFCSQVGMAMSEYYLDAGCDVIAVVDPMTSQIGEEQFRQFVTGPAKQVFDHIRKRGGLSSFFVCGYAQHNIHPMCECGPDNLSVDENVPLDVLRDAARQHRISFGGNLKLTEVLLLGSVDESRRHAMDCMDTSGGEGYILAPGCDLPYDTPPQNLAAVGELVNDPYQQDVVRTMAVHHQEEDLPDMAQYGAVGPVQIDVITLDSASCAPCQYMVEAVKSAVQGLEGQIEWREHPIKERESIRFMKALGVKNIPAICIDGRPEFISIIPKQDELQRHILERIEMKSTNVN